MAIKRITSIDAGNILAAIDMRNADFGIKTEFANLADRDKCLAVEVIFEAVDAHRAANRVSRQTPAQAKDQPQPETQGGSRTKETAAAKAGE